jgi:tRNA G18 (ribose-2'-O)-methylase SpoU
MRPKLNAKQLRDLARPNAKPEEIYTTPLVFILDNIQDTYNIGSFFRLADAVAAQKIYLCGRVVTPPNVKIHRASVGLWRWLPWEQHLSVVSLTRRLKKQGFFIVAAEQTRRSIDYRRLRPKFPVALVIGNETDGVNSEVLKIADSVAEVPLLGVNRSLNVLVAASVISYHLISFL